MCRESAEQDGSDKDTSTYKIVPPASISSIIVCKTPQTASNVNKRDPEHKNAIAIAAVA